MTRGVPRPASDPALRSEARIASTIGSEIREARHRRRWTLRELGTRCGLTASAIQKVEAGSPASLESYGRIGVALGLRPELHLVDDRQRPRLRADDPVHAWMGDAQAMHLQGLRLPVAIDEPYQHYQFAGRADVVSWDVERRALLHIENRTRFPNIQDAAGSFNAKRAYLAPAVAARLRIRGGFASVTHVVCALWSAEVQHVVRLRTSTFRALCPDSSEAFEAWWRGHPPTSGQTSTFILFDPQIRARARRWVGIDDTLRVDRRYQGYADAVAAVVGTANDAGHAVATGRRSVSTPR